MLRAYNGRKAFGVALDNDAAGQRGREKARNETLNWVSFKLSSECPKHKDWNDDLIGVAERLGPPKFREIRVSSAMNNDPHDQILDAYFWHFVRLRPRPRRHAAFHRNLRRRLA